MKYIIKNCPAYQKELITMDYKTGETIITDKNYCINPFLPNACQDCTDCVLKRIVEFVKWRDEESVCNSCGLGIPHRKEEFQRILNMLKIEECENE